MPASGMSVWDSAESTDPGARQACIHLIQVLLLTDSVTSGRTFHILDAASVKCRGALRISKNVCKSSNTVSGTYYALSQRLILIAIVINAKEIGLKTRSRLVLLRRNMEKLLRSFFCVMYPLVKQQNMVSPKKNLLIKICLVLQFVLVDSVSFQKAKEVRPSAWLLLASVQGTWCIIPAQQAENGVELGLPAETLP